VSRERRERTCACAQQYGKAKLQRASHTSLSCTSHTSPCGCSERFPSGCLTLDRALGGGYPKGRIVEVYGPEASGKTTLALHAIAEVQRQGGHCVFIDAEHAFDAAYAAVSCRGRPRGKWAGFVWLVEGRSFSPVLGWRAGQLIPAHHVSI
jgi:RecA/RadA recombinase